MSKYVSTKSGSSIPEVEIVRNLRVSNAEATTVASQFGGYLPKMSSFIFFLADPSNRQKSIGKWFRIDASEGLPDFVGYARIDYKHGQLVKVTREEWKSLPLEEQAWVSPAPAPRGSSTVGLLVKYGYDSTIAITSAIEDSTQSIMAFERK